MSENKRIAKNTVLLYIRMLVLMVISLYTSRVILKVLGVVDYGIYNIVGGVVVLFAFLQTSLSGATQRFLSFSLGEENGKNLHKTFCTSLTLHIFLGLLMVFLLETIGYWFFKAKLNIPPPRYPAAIWIYHISVAVTFFNIVRVPYNATLIAYERMDYFAYLSILEGALKLGIVFMIPLFNFDKLIFYGFLILLSTIIILLVNASYCMKKFPDSRYNPILDKKQFLRMVDYSGWSLLGGVANIARTQGVNILLNIHINVIVNAAMGISTVVSNSASSFMNNFTTAFSPQIVKLYAQKEISAYHKLIVQSSKFSFMLMAFIAVPLILCIDDVLSVWLGEYPQYTSAFCICCLIAVLFDSFASALWTAIGAVGKMRNYQITMFVICILVLPYSWIMLKLGKSPVWCVMGNVFANAAMLICRLFFINHYTKFNMRYYIFHVLSKGLVCVCLSFVILHFIPSVSEKALVNILYYTTISILLNTAIFYIIFLNEEERVAAKSIVRKFTNK